MANGASVLKLIAPERPPRTVPAPDLWIEIGEAMVIAATWVAAAMEEYQCRDGSLSGAVKSIGGERIARLVHLQMATEGQLDFNAVATREGKRRLRAIPRCRTRFPASGMGQRAAKQRWTSSSRGALEIVANVVKFEKILAAARAN